MRAGELPIEYKPICEPKLTLTKEMTEAKQFKLTILKSRVSNSPEAIILNYDLEKGEVIANDAVGLFHVEHPNKEELISFGLNNLLDSWKAEPNLVFITKAKILNMTIPKDTYKVGDVIVEKTSETCFEVCPYCDEEVELETRFEKQPCPKCGSIIIPCNLCLTNIIKCGECPIEKEETGCKGYSTTNMDGTEYDCEYEFAGEVSCDNCIFGPPEEKGTQDPRVDPNLEEE